MNNPVFTFLSEIPNRSRALIVASAIALVCSAPAASLAAPGHSGTGIVAPAAQNVDYIGPDAASALDLEFPVLVPSWVPAPFAGSPSINGGGSSYSLYWMNAGGEPTFLQVTGQVGGALPAGSPYDLNVQLFINAQVQGYGAIHDVTPAYDTVWWIAGGVLYKVESRNSTTDSLTLANSLIAFVPPSAPEPEPDPTSPPPAETPAPDVPTSEPETPDSEPGSDSGGSTTLPAPGESAGADQAPAVNAVDPTTGPTDVDETTPLIPDELTPPSSTSEELLATTPETPEVTPIGSDGTGQPSVSSDGTGGAQNLIVGGDGTGGTRDVIVVPLQPTDSPTP